MRSVLTKFTEIAKNGQTHVMGGAHHSQNWWPMGLKGGDVHRPEDRVGRPPTRRNDELNQVAWMRWKRIAQDWFIWWTLEKTDMMKMCYYFQILRLKQIRHTKSELSRILWCYYHCQQSCHWLIFSVETYTKGKQRLNLTSQASNTTSLRTINQQRIQVFCQSIRLIVFMWHPK